MVVHAARWLPDSRTKSYTVSHEARSSIFLEDPVAVVLLCAAALMVSGSVVVRIRSGSRQEHA